MSSVTLNTWWVSEPEQRYWMEITDRADLGGPLESPKLERLTWGYDLVSHVQPGDRVLHWSTRGSASGLVGWSEVTSYPSVVASYSWTPRHGERRSTAGWRVELGEFHPLGPITAVDLLPHLDKIVAIDQRLKKRHRGAVYFPLTRYGAGRAADKQEIRATQAYFVKFPAELFGIIPGIVDARIDGMSVTESVTVAEDFQRPGKKIGRGRVARAADPALRRAIERRSLDVAREYYDSIGGLGYREVGAPYDVAVVVDGTPRHCEVKGSSLTVDTVELTINEVEHADLFPIVDLIVVDGIEPIRNDSNEVVGAVGGRLRVWTSWVPASNALQATKFAYTLPAGGGRV